VGAQRRIHLVLTDSANVAGTLDAIGSIPGVLATTLASTSFSQDGA
jgi:hypothetical protein